MRVRPTWAVIPGLLLALGCATSHTQPELDGTVDTSVDTSADTSPTDTGGADSDAISDDGCPPGLTDCGGTCVSLASDPDHCGSCGHECSPEEFCADGTCSTDCVPT